ncbi:MAG: hypothetical protein LBL00_08530 [Endomicrobium sp.]|nr:hypothetical protein [Endomicrobium sp.]
MAGIKCKRLFDVLVGRFVWRVSITNDEAVLKGLDYYFGFGDVYVSEKLSLRERNIVILEMLFMAVLVDSNQYFMLKEVLDSDFETVIDRVSFALRDLFLDGNLATLLKTEVRKGKYKQKLKMGHLPATKIKLSEAA